MRGWCWEWMCVWGSLHLHLQLPPLTHPENRCRRHLARYFFKSSEAFASVQIDAQIEIQFFNIIISSECSVSAVLFVKILLDTAHILILSPLQHRWKPDRSVEFRSRTIARGLLEMSVRWKHRSTLSFQQLFIYYLVEIEIYPPRMKISKMYLRSSSWNSRGAPKHLIYLRHSTVS